MEATRTPLMDILAPPARSAAAFFRKHLLRIAVLFFIAVGLTFAVMLADEQNREDVRYGLPLRVSCEEDSESDLWRGGCERIAADIARKDRPSFADLYSTFVALHHATDPIEVAARSFADQPVDPAFDPTAEIKGTRYVISPQLFAGARNSAHARAIMLEIDKRDRARLLVSREGLTLKALAAATLANLTDAAALIAITLVAGLLLVLRRRLRSRL